MRRRGDNLEFAPRGILDSDRRPLGQRDGASVDNEFSIFPPASPVRYAASAMFDVIKEQLRTAADKLTHLRRFL
jgi:hypothetical protein